MRAVRSPWEVAQSTNQASARHFFTPVVFKSVFDEDDLDRNPAGLLLDSWDCLDTWGEGETATRVLGV